MVSASGSINRPRRSFQVFVYIIALLTVIFVLASCGEEEAVLPEETVVLSTFTENPSGGQASQNVPAAAESFVVGTIGADGQENTVTPVTETETAPADPNNTAGTPEGTAGNEESQAPSEMTLPHMIENPDLVTDSKAYCVMDQNGTVWLGKNELTALPPASITKVMTALVVCERVALTDVVTISENAVNQGIAIMSSGVNPSFRPGEQVTVQDLLYALILPSTNSAGNILAEYVGGSVDNFVAMMNQKLQELSLTHSHFMNPHGLDQEGHYVSAYDMCVILRAAASNPYLRPILGARSYMIPATAYASERSMNMGHKMVSGAYEVPGVYAGKPGWTVNAQGTLVTAVERNGQTFYVCTLGSDDGCHYDDTANLIEYAYAALEGRTPNLRAIVHDPVITAEDAAGITIHASVNNHPTSLRTVYWDMAAGTGSAVFGAPLAASESMDIRLDLPYQGTYVVQLCAQDSFGRESVIGLGVLHSGNLAPCGIYEWNGKHYYINDTHFMETDAIETPAGCYYADQQGALVFNAFAGGRFYVGPDGRMVSGWQSVDGATYYFQADGRMAIGTIIIDGVAHVFSDIGIMLQ